jgi:hypothetical protein
MAPAKKQATTKGTPVSPRALVTEPIGTFTLPTQGPFSLEAAATFGFGHTTETEFDGVMRLAFCLDGPGPDGTAGSYETHVGVEVRQDGDELHCIAYGSDELDRRRAGSENRWDSYRGCSGSQRISRWQDPESSSMA